MEIFSALIRLFSTRSGIEIERMMRDIQVEYLFQGRFDVLDTWVAEFYDLACISAYDVIMLFMVKGLLIMGLLLPEAVFAHLFTF